MERLIKNTLGQWKIVKELTKTNSGASNLLKTDDVVHPIDPAHSDHLSKIFNEAKGLPEDAQHQKIKEGIAYINAAPRGSVDIGHTMRLADFQNAEPPYIRGTNDMIHAAVNRHVGDGVRSLKRVHEKFGDDGLKAMFHVVGGASGDPHEYSTSSIHPRLFHEALELMNPRKAKYEREHNTHLPGVPTDNQYTASFGHPDHAGHQEIVDKTFQEQYDDDLSNESVNAHEDAVLNRAMAVFKHHHKIK